MGWLSKSKAPVFTGMIDTIATYEAFRNELKNYYCIFYDVSKFKDLYIVQSFSGGYLMVARYFDVRGACYATFDFVRAANYEFDEDVTIIKRAKIAGILDIDHVMKGHQVMESLRAYDADERIYMN